jgi:nicotinate-nucleotide--dimethylbenzimidazole phosphoribosyltransferase
MVAHRSDKATENMQRGEVIIADEPTPPDDNRRTCDAIIRSIRPIAKEIQPAAQRKIDEKTKPLGALGQLEDLALQMSLIQKRLDPVINRKALFVFASDHGIAAEGVSAYPAKVTGEMVKNIIAGGAAINVLCRHYGIDIRLVDMGVNADFEDNPLLLKEKIRRGTRNFAVEEAMTPAECTAAAAAGMNAFLREHTLNSIDIVGLGEMGIANTTSASAIISVVTGISARQATGRGTGVDDKGLARKTTVIEKAIQFHHPDPRDGFDVLRKIGGYEIAGIVGAVLAAASVGCAVVLDGLISTAAGLIAFVINPEIEGYLMSGHRSVEAGQQAALTHMGLEPIVDHRMRLGEGTGAAMAISAVEAACRIMCEMASFDDAGVSKNE